MYEKEASSRRTLQSKLVAAGGNIRVYCRVRPRSAEEVRSPLSCIPLFSLMTLWMCLLFSLHLQTARDDAWSVFVTGDAEVAVNMEAGHRKTFDFDRVFPPECSQGTDVRCCFLAAC